MKTQTQRILKALQTAGPRGVTAADFARSPACDGGDPILRVAARVMELRQAGHEIAKDGIRDKCAVYVWQGRKSEVLAADGERFVVADEWPASLWQEARVVDAPANALYGDAA